MAFRACQRSIPPRLWASIRLVSRFALPFFASSKRNMYLSKFSTPDTGEQVSKFFVTSLRRRAIIHASLLSAAGRAGT